MFCQTMLYFRDLSLGVNLFQRKVYLIDWLISVHLNPVSEIRLVVRDSAMRSIQPERQL